MKIKAQKLKFKGIRFLVTVLVSVCIYGCATESAPLGGPEDTTPPKVKSASPPDKTVNFNSGKIVLTFDEFILAGGFAQTIISPPIEPKPDIRGTNKSITIRFKGDLKDNTTYTINFGDDIKDNNQANVLSNFTYVFSTGTYIDSQQVSGNVITAKTGEPTEGIIVMLYSPDSVNPVLNSKPVYFSKTNSAGSYNIQNVKAGKYQVFGLKDVNFNYQYDQANEAISFADELLDLTDTVPQQLDLVSFQESKRYLKFQNVKNLEPGKLMVTYGGALNTLKLDGTIFKDGYFSWNYPTNDTVIVWYSTYYKSIDTIILTANDTLLDTVRLELKNIAKDSVEQLSKYSLSLANQSVLRVNKSDSAKNSNTQELYGSLKINLSRPITVINESKPLQIVADSSTKDTINPTWKLNPTTKQEIEFSFDRKEKTGYTVIIPDSVFQDVFGLWNKQLTWKFKTSPKDNYGNINLKLTVSDINKNYVVKLLNSSEEEIATYKLKGESQHTDHLYNLPAGIYHVQIIEDANGNGVWDTGDFQKRKQPEKILQFKDTYSLKGLWDLDVEVKF